MLKAFIVYWKVLQGFATMSHNFQDQCLLLVNGNSLDYSQRLHFCIRCDAVFWCRFCCKSTYVICHTSFYYGFARNPTLCIRNGEIHSENLHFRNIMNMLWISTRTPLCVDEVLKICKNYKFLQMFGAKPTPQICNVCTQPKAGYTWVDILADLS